nr:unnamed protein product [Digitaria exilis]
MAGRRPCGCSLVRLLQQALVAAVLVVIILYRHGHGFSNLSSRSSASRDVDAFFGSPPAATNARPAASGGDAASATCATVERMGEEAAGQGSPEAASLRVRELIRHHFELHGAFNSIHPTIYEHES